MTEMTDSPRGFGWKLLFALNGIVVAGFAVGWGYVALVVPLDAQMRVTEIDRAGVINEEALQQSYPQLADSVRDRLGPWIAEKDHHAALFFAGLGTLVAAVNCAMVFLCRPKKTEDAETTDRQRISP